MVDFTGGTWRSLIDGQEVSATPDSVVENFERSDPIDDYSGNTEDASVETTDTIEGDQSLQWGSSDGGNEIHTDFSVDGPTPSKGDVFSVLYKDQGGKPGFYFASKDGNGISTMYGMEGNAPQDGSTINFQKNASTQTEGSWDTDASDGDVYELVFVWHDGNYDKAEDTLEFEAFEWDVDNWERGPSASDNLTFSDSDHIGNPEYGFYSGDDSTSNRVYDFVVIGPVGGLP